MYEAFQKFILIRSRLSVRNDDVPPEQFWHHSSYMSCLLPMVVSPMAITQQRLGNRAQIWYDMVRMYLYRGPIA